MAGIIPERPKLIKTPALSGLSAGSENLSHNETIIERLPNTQTTDRYMTFGW